MDGTRHTGFRVEEGAYEQFARAVDPHGDDVRNAAERHVTPYIELSGDGFSEMGDEAGLRSAYAARTRNLSERLSALGGDWQRMADAARRTGANYDVVEAEQRATLDRLGRGLG